VTRRSFSATAGHGDSPIPDADQAVGRRPVAGRRPRLIHPVRVLGATIVAGRAGEMGS
jgi:hypothetical protein